MVPYFGVALMGSYYLGSYNRVRYFRKPSNDIGTVVAGSIAGVVLIPEGMAYPFEDLIRLGRGRGGGGLGGGEQERPHSLSFACFLASHFFSQTRRGWVGLGRGGVGGIVPSLKDFNVH